MGALLSAAGAVHVQVHDRPRLGELLVRAGYITDDELEWALIEQATWGGRMGELLVDHGLVDEAALAAAIAHQLYLEVVDLDTLPLSPHVVRLVPLALAERYGLVAIDVDGERRRIVLACFDPTNNEAMREVRSATGLVPAVCVATASQIDRTIRRHYYGDAEPGRSPLEYGR